MYTKQKCIQRIYDTAKEKSIKIGDLEKNAGVSPGYLSRIIKEDSTSTMSVDLLVAIADQLHVSVEYLLTDYDILNESESYLFRFFEKIKQETSKGKYEWEILTITEMEKLGYGDDDQYPFFESCYDKDGNPDIEYKNRFHEGGENWLNGPFYWTKFGQDGSVVYITNITHFAPDYIHGGATFENAVDEYEVYIKDNTGKLIPLCNTSFISQALTDQIDSLYTLITETQVGIRVTPEVRHIIDNYFNEKDMEPFPSGEGDDEN